MENTGEIFFEGDDTPRWYVAMGSGWIGPMTASDIYEKILSNHLSWAHYVWRQGQSEWKRICDTKTFQAAVPRQPGKAIQSAVKGAVKGTTQPIEPRRQKRSESEGQVWYLHYNDSQYGPFSQEEIQRFLLIGKIHSRVYAWREGMKTWERIARIPVFQKAEAKKPEARKPEEISRAPMEQRATPRSPLVAKIWMSDEQTVIVGVCRDISIGGLQVLTEKIPGKVGSKLKMNISPSPDDAGDEPGKNMGPIVAKGVIVRILEDHRGFSFRFENLSDRAKQAIESYIESAN